ncbi:MAG: DUF167 domain-containing protein [Schlesneria sp.]
MVSLEQTASGLVLPVKAQPGARRNGVTGVHDGALKVAVSQAPEKGKATAAIMNVLAESLEIKKNQIELLSGQTSTHKKFLIRDIDFNEMMMRISKLLAELESA